MKKSITESTISKKRADRKVLIATGILFVVMSAMNNNLLGAVTSYGAESATFSEYWFQDSNGDWKVQDNNGNVIKNAWLCDDSVTSNGQDVWYLLDESGSMVTAGLVQDGTGNYYSLETNHNGFYGMLRYKSGNYDGIDLTLEGSHSGAFASVLNQDGLNALKSKYGVTSVSNISNANCVYTSNFGSSSSRSSGGSQQVYNENNITAESSANAFATHKGSTDGAKQGDLSELDPALMDNYMRYIHGEKVN